MHGTMHAWRMCIMQHCGWDLWPCCISLSPPCYQHISCTPASVWPLMAIEHAHVPSLSLQAPSAIPACGLIGPPCDMCMHTKGGAENTQQQRFGHRSSTCMVSTATTPVHMHQTVTVFTTSTAQLGPHLRCSHPSPYVVRTILTSFSPFLLPSPHSFPSPRVVASHGPWSWPSVGEQALSLWPSLPPASSTSERLCSTHAVQVQYNQEVQF